jgi:deoxycytidine triphosphate deaminase
MMLSNRTLLSRLHDADIWEPWQRIEVDPVDPAAIQPHSIDVHLGDTILLYTGAVTDTQRDNSPWWKKLEPEAHPDGPDGPRLWVLQPDRLYLSVLKERIVVPEDCCAQLGGVSSRARDGVMIHQQAGLLDAGWEGRATLEISVKNPHTVIYTGQRIGQVTFTLLDARADPPYRGRYQHDSEPQPARMLLGVAA